MEADQLGRLRSPNRNPCAFRDGCWWFDPLPFNPTAIREYLINDAIFALQNTLTRRERFLSSRRESDPGQRRKPRFQFSDDFLWFTHVAELLESYTAPPFGATICIGLGVWAESCDRFAADFL